MSKTTFSIHPQHIMVRTTRRCYKLSDDLRELCSIYLPNDIGCNPIKLLYKASICVSCNKDVYCIKAICEKNINNIERMCWGCFIRFYNEYKNDGNGVIYLITELEDTWAVLYNQIAYKKTIRHHNQMLYSRNPIITRYRLTCNYCKNFGYCSRNMTEDICQICNKIALKVMVYRYWEVYSLIAHITMGDICDIIRAYMIL